MVEATKLKDMETQVLEAFKPFEHFCKAMLDAWVVVDLDGRVLKTNQLFASLVGKKTKEIYRVDSIDSLLSLSISKDESLNVSKIVNEHDEPWRIDEVRGQTTVNPNLNLIISMYPFFDATTKAKIGAFILLRDVTAETQLQDKYKTTAIKSMTDPLTGLFTRNYFDSWFNMQTQLAVESGVALNCSLIMVDIDFFKKINDGYGHQAGDHVLQVVGKLMKKTLRKTDIPCRYGGEEFLVILPTTLVSDAAIAANKLREAIKAELMEFDKRTIPVTISCGVAELSNGETHLETIKRADAALYKAKESGRNQVQLHDGTAIKPFKA